MPDRIILICRPVLDRSDMWLFPDGTTTDRCRRCGVEIWLAPSGQQLRQRGAIPICIPCGLPNAKRVGATVTKEQLEEIEREVPGGAAKVKNILRRFNARHN